MHTGLAQKTRNLGEFAHTLAHCEHEDTARSGGFIYAFPAINENDTSVSF